MSSLKPLVLAFVLAASAVDAAPLAAIDGRVVDDANAPIGGARVCAVMPVLTCAVTGVTGTFTLPDLDVADAREIDIAAQRPQYVVSSWNRLATSTARHAQAIVVMTAGGAEITGVVRGGLDGRPIAHAVVRSDNAIAETDAAGRYGLWVAHTLSSEITASAYGFGVERVLSTTPTQHDFALFPEATIRGTVIDASTGRPMPHARVAASHAFGPTLRVAISDDRGKFVFDQIAPEIYQLGVEDSHAFGVRASTLAVRLGEHVTGVVVAARPAFEISGRMVIDAIGTPCPSGGVLVVTGGGWARGEADASGIARVPVMPGTYHLRVWCSHYLESDSDVVVTDRDVGGLVWQLGKGASITGRVVDTHGVPVFDADVYADPLSIDADPTHATSDHTTTGRDGSFTVSGLRRGHQGLRVIPQYGPSTDETLVVEVSPDHVVRHDFVVDNAASRVIGHVRFADGSPAANVEIDLTAGSDVETAGTDSAGMFTFDQIRGDRHATLAIDDTALPIAGVGTSGVAVHLVPGVTTHLELTTTAVPGAIRGRVVDPSGRPIDDAIVAVDQYNAVPPNLGMGAAVEVPVDAYGEFVVGHLLGSRFHLRAYRKSGGEVVEQPVALGANLALTLLEPGSIAATVRIDGTPAREFKIELDATSLDLPVQWLSAATDDGKISFAGVTAGRYRLKITGGVGTKTVDVNVVTGQATAVQIDVDHPCHVLGHIVDARSKQPIHNVTITSDRFGSDLVSPDNNGNFDLMLDARVATDILVLGDRSDSGPLPRLAVRHVGANADTIQLGDIAVTAP